MIAHCPKCGWTWDPSFISLGIGGQLSMSGNLTTCIKCGQVAELLDGDWVATEQGLQLISGPERSITIYQAFQSLVEEAKLGNLTPQQVQIKATQLDEGLGKAISVLMLRYPKSFVFIIALSTMLKFMNIETTLDVNQLLKQVIEYVDNSRSSEKTSGSEMNKPKDKETSHDADASQKSASQKQNKIRQSSPPSQTYKFKN